MISKRRNAFGERNGVAKLTEAQVTAILDDPRLHRVIAAEYGMTQAMISRIKRREAWAHLGGTPERRKRGGVYLHKGGKWQAELWHEGKRFYLGLFVNSEAAARAINNKRDILSPDKKTLDR